MYCNMLTDIVSGINYNIIENRKIAFAQGRS